MTKQSITKILLTILISMMGTNAFAHDIEVANNDGVIIYYVWKNDSKTELAVSFSGYDSYYSSKNRYSGNVVIPESVTYMGTEYPVTGISYAAFRDCLGLTSIIIPTSVTTIDTYAFYGTSLVSVTLPNGLTKITDYSFGQCRSLISVTIPNSVTTIEGSAFEDCVSLTSIDIPNSVTSLGGFTGCSGLTSITIPTSVTTIGTSAFMGCSSLTSINIPNSVTNIDFGAFSGCTGLTSITIPNSVTNIGNNAFQYCSGLTNITIPKSITSIGNYAFEGCSCLTSVSFYCPVIDSWFKGFQNINEVVLGDEVTTIGANAFRNCSGLTKVTIGSGLTRIEKEAFEGCSKLQKVIIKDISAWCGIYFGNNPLWKSTRLYSDENTEITKLIIPNSVTSISKGAFAYCSGLNSVDIPNTVTSIGIDAFYGCIGLLDLNIPNSVITIGNGAFWDCNGLSSVIIGNSVSEIGNLAFYGCENLKKIYCYPEEAPTLGSQVFNSSPYIFVSESAYPSYVSSQYWRGCTIMTKEVDAIEVGGIYYNLYALSPIAEVTKNPNGNSDLPSITIPKTIVYNDKTYEVKKIDDYAFSECRSLISVTIPSSVTSIGQYSFQNCNSLFTVTLSDGVTEIGYGAFSDCSTLSSLTIPNSVTYIGEKAFRGCSNLASVTISNNLTNIENELFSKCTKLSSVTIPQSITSIGSYAFQGCSSLTGMTIPNSVTNIGAGAFYGCSALESLNIPEGVTSIEDRTFYMCSGLTSFTIPNSVTSIGESVFYACDGMTSINIPNSVTTIGESAFENCIRMASLNIPEGLKAIKKNTFKKCYSLKTITIPSSVEYIYQEAFGRCTGLESINVLSTTPPFLFDDSFSNYSVPLIVPKGCKEVYSTAQGWKNFTQISDGYKYKLTYVVDGEEYKSYEIEDGETISPESVPTKEGYTFSGWSDIPETMPAHDVTVTGTFTVNKYKLTYSVDGEEYKSYDIEYGSTITSETEPTKEGYTFSGWSDLPETMPAKDVTVTGTFTVNKYKLIYTVDGKEYKSYDIEYGSTITSETEPTKEGYTFSGWSDLPETMPAKDVTVTGTFTVNKYKLTYSVDGEEYKSYDIEYGSTITSETEPTKEGYTFSGWSDIPETMPAKDVNVTGAFTVNMYKLTYSVDGEKYKSYDIEYGSTITSETEPTKEGYTFSGWSDLPETMPAKDVTVTGSFTINKYKVTYMINGEVYQTVEVEYGSTITPPNPGDREGYDFAWGDYPSTMPAEDITINGSYTATDIRAVLADESDVKIYNVSGKPLNNLQKGVNILRYKDGRTQKLIIK